VARSLDARLFRYPIRDGSDLTIDVALFDGTVESTLVVSSGVHGVEGPFGSAVQLAWLDRFRQQGRASGVGLVFIHAVNPFGFAHHRRWNEDNVDLNRNFLDEVEDYAGAPSGYVRVQSLLNPETIPSRTEPFRLKAAWTVLRFGLPVIKQAIASGQYEYPKGLFFGGKQACASTLLLRDHIDSWVGDASQIVHLDLHTGLGRFADYRLLLDGDAGPEEAEWFASVFGEQLVERFTADGTAYRARGTLGRSLTHQLRKRRYRFATVEFGTYGLVRVLAALRAENRVHHYASDRNRFAWVENELRECFCPKSLRWRRAVVDKSMTILDRCTQALGSDLE
jgi:hypothetical protein